MAELQDVTLDGTGSSIVVRTHGAEPAAGRWSNGKTAGSNPANRRSNRRRPANSNTRRGRNG